MSCCLCVSFVIFALLGVFKIYYKLTTKWNRSYTCLIGKTAIVTGANTGIGYVTALDFAQRGARVILACRNKEKAEEALKKIVKATGNENVVVKIIDMQSLDSVREFAKDINETEARIDILVNNAGAIVLGNHRTKDDLQITMQVNHFSPFLLTHLLIDKLKNSTPSRIVNVSSMAAKHSKLHADTMNDYPDQKKLSAENTLYSNSKLCNILFTTELAKKLDGTGVTVNCLHPGVILTDVMRSIPPVLQKIFTIIQRFFFMTREEGAQTTVFVALAKEIEGVTGKLFANCEEITMYDTADNISLAKEVWIKSEKLVKLKECEKI